MTRAKLEKRPELRDLDSARGTVLGVVLGATLWLLAAAACWKLIV